MARCIWVPDDELYRRYHDEEWGVPLCDDRALFELLALEGCQAGLSWRTILHRREGYRRAFHGFVPDVVARFDLRDLDRLMQDPGVIRHRGKLAAIIRNAQAFLGLMERHGSFSDYIWSFVSGTPLVHHFTGPEEVPAQSPQSRAMADALRKQGFAFVGATTCYAFMQSAGLVMDHETSCFRYPDLCAPDGTRADR